MLSQIGHRLRGLARADAVLWAVSLGHGLTHWYPGAFYVILPLLAKELNLSYGEVGFLMTTRSVVSTVVNLPGGMLVDLIGRRGLVMAIALAWAGLPYFLLGFGSSYSFMVLCLALAGMGNNLWHPAAMSALSERYPERRGFALSIHILGANLGDTLGPLVIGLVLVYLTWRDVVIINILPAILVAVVIWRYLFDSDQLREVKEVGRLNFKGYLVGLKALASNLSVILVVTVSGIRSMTHNGLLIFLPIYLANELNLGPAMVGLYLSVIQGAGILGSPIAGTLSDKTGRKPIITSGLLVSSVAVIILGFLNIGWLFIIVLALFGFFMYSLRPVFFAWTMDLAPKGVEGTAIGLIFGSQSFFGSLSPILGGLIADRYGILTTFYFLGLTLIAANLLLLAVPEHKKETGKGV